MINDEWWMMSDKWWIMNDKWWMMNDECTQMRMQKILITNYHFHMESDDTMTFSDWWNRMSKYNDHQWVSHGHFAPDCKDYIVLSIIEQTRPIFWPFEIVKSGGLRSISQKVNSLKRVSAHFKHILNES